MTISKLFHELAKIAYEHGWECRVRVVDGEGEWPFSIHVEELVDEAGTRRVVYLDTTDPDQGDVIEPTPLAPNVTDEPPYPGSD